MNEKLNLTENRNRSESSSAKQESKLISDEDLSTLSAWDKLMLRFHALPGRTRGIILAAVVLVLILTGAGFLRDHRPAKTTVQPPAPYEVPAAEPVVEQGVDLPDDDEWMWIPEEDEVYGTDLEAYDDWDYEEDWERGRNGAVVQRTDSGLYYYVKEADDTWWDYFYDDNDKFLRREGYLTNITWHLGRYEPIPGLEWWKKVKPIYFDEPIAGSIYAISMGFYIDTSLDATKLIFDVYGTSASDSEERLQYIGSFNYDPSNLWGDFYYTTLDGEGNGTGITDLQSLYIVPVEDEVYDDLKTAAVEISLIEVTRFDYEY